MAKQSDSETADLDALNTLSDIERELDRLTTSSAEERIVESRRIALYARAASLPEADEGGIVEFICTSLLRDCLISTSDKSLQSATRDRLRDILGNWLDALSEPLLWRVRPNLIRQTVELLFQSPSNDALYILSAAIGYRDAEVVEALRSTAERDDELGDTALRLLIGMRVSGDQLKMARERLKARLTNGPPTNELLNALAILGENWVIDELATNAGHAAQEWHLFSRFLWICERAPGDEVLQNRVWDAVVALADSREQGWAELLFTGGALRQCNTTRVIDTLIARLPKIVASQGVYRLGNQIEQITSPVHTQRMIEQRITPNVDSLRTFAVQPSGPTIRSNTLEGHLKSYAWSIGLFFGSPDVQEWLRDAVDKEENPYQQHKLMSWLSILEFAALPTTATRLLGDAELVFTKNSDATSVLPFLASARLASSVLSIDGLRLLINANGLTDGHPYVSAVEDAAQLAEWLAYSGDPNVIELLGGSLRKPSPMAQSCAVRGLLMCVGGKNKLGLQSDISSVLLDIVRDEAYPPYIRADAIRTVCLGNREFAHDNGRLFSSLCAHSDEQLRFAAAWGILELGLFDLYEKDVLICAYRSFPQHRVSPDKIPNSLTNHEAFLIGQLCAIHPELYGYDAALIVENAFTTAASEALRGLTSRLALGAPAPKSIVDAIVRRIKNAQSLRSASLFLFRALGDLSPTTLLEERWEAVFHEWMADSREALAKSVIYAAKSVDDEARIRAIELLRRLLSDGVFAVRRAAARVLSNIDVGALEKTCDEWIASGAIFLRIRAAEAAASLPADNSVSIDNRIQRALESDPERRVREAVERSREQLRRQLWSAEHLRAVQSGSSNQPNSWVLSRYASGQALSSIGDDFDSDELTRFMSQNLLPPNVSHWLARIKNGLDDQWRETTRKWPDPWLPWRGSVEEVQGNIEISGKAYPADITLWLRPPEDDDARSEWGGAARQRNFGLSGFNAIFSEERGKARLLVDGRSAASIVIVSSNTAEEIFVGSDEYPRPT